MKDIMMASNKAQTFEERVEVNQLEKLSGYEMHPDCKFEHTLTMLLKLKQLPRA